MKRIISFLLFLGLALNLYGEPPKNFRQARQLLLGLHPKGGTSFYCACPYEIKLKSKGLAGLFIPSCPMLKGKSRQLSFEHVVPAQVIGQRLGVWKACQSDKGKKKTARECAMSDPRFRLITADPYNLFSAIMRVNASRGSRSYAISRAKNTNHCQMEVRQGEAFVTPQLADNIARVYLYMDQAYPELRLLNLKEKIKFSKWDKLDEASEADCDRFEKILQKTGLPNPIMEAACHLAPLH